MATDHEAAIATLEQVLAGEMDTLDELYAALPNIAPDSPLYLTVSAQYIPAAHEAVNETKALIWHHKLALIGGQQ